MANSKLLEEFKACFELTLDDAQRALTDDADKDFVIVLFVHHVGLQLTDIETQVKQSFQERLQAKLRKVGGIIKKGMPKMLLVMDKRGNSAVVFLNDPGKLGAVAAHCRQAFQPGTGMNCFRAPFTFTNG